MTVLIRPMTPEEYERWVPLAQESYAADMVANGGFDTAAAAAKAERDFASLLTGGLDSDGHWLYTVEDDGQAAGELWLSERDSDAGRTLFVYDVHIDEGRRGRGLGRSAMVFAEEEARRRGIPRVSLNVFGGNDVARSLYRSLGYVEAAVWMTKDV